MHRWSLAMQIAKLYARFLGVTLFTGVVFVGYIWLISLIISDRTMGFQHQIVRYQNELIRGDYPGLNDLDLLIVGDSTASQNVLAPDLPLLKAASLAAPGISSIESYYNLKRYLTGMENRPSPRCVLLMTSYGAQAYHIENFFWPLTVGHSLLRREDALDLYENSIKIHAWPSNRYSRWNYYLKIISEQVGYHLQFNSLKQLLFQPNLTFNHSQRSYRLFRRMDGSGPLQRRPQWLENRFNGPNQEFLTKPFNPDPVLDLYIEKIAKLTQERGIPLAVAYGPLASSVRDETSERWLNDAIEHVGKIIAPFPHVSNLQKVEWMIDSKFADSTHLKWAFAAEYTKELGKKLSHCAQR